MTTKKGLSHVAIIPDGNRRWAKQLHKPAIYGHEAGYKRLKECISYARLHNVEIITIWAFSTENWKRSQEEVGDLMTIITKGLSKIHKEAKKEKSRVIHIGRRDRLGVKLLNLIEKIEEETKEYKGFTLCLAIDYGGEDELRRAEEKMLLSNQKVKRIQDFLDTNEYKLPDPDLIIRTGGEVRTSGFMPLQSSYSEWVFEEKLFPDFTVEVFKHTLEMYNSRTRRFGK
jgi:undecaprenyl diphosphate synthase